MISLFKLIPASLLFMTLAFSNCGSESKKSGTTEAPPTVPDKKLKAKENVTPAKDISDEELVTFAAALKIAEDINSKNRLEMIRAIEEAGINIDLYNEIETERRNLGKMPNVSDEIKAKMEHIEVMLEEMRVDNENNILIAIEQDGKIETERYQAILEAVKRNPELTKKVQALLQQ